MKRIFFSFLVILAYSTISYAAQMQSYRNYISQWKAVALQHQTEYQIPACITLAQGLLESGAGSSELARNANNHFGIKCTSDWLGDSYRHDDETRQECFRKYVDATDSYRDHALFLKRTRYARLFDLPISDYQGWAQGLKDCGYATDPTYPQKLIRIIEDYGLDTLSASIVDGAAEKLEVPTTMERSAAKPVVVSRSEPIATITADPEQEYVEPLSAYKEKKEFFATHRRVRVNNRTYVLANEGDTYANVAFRLNKKERTLRKDNDALGRVLKQGDPIFLGKKANKAPKEKALMWVHPGETLWEVAQREGIRIDAIRKYNGFDKKVLVFKTRQTILLRPKKDE